jgi:hypothetical protein
MDLIFDEESSVYLRVIADNLLKTGSTRATPAALPEIIRFQINVNNDVWDVETMDFAGGFLAPTRDHQMKKLAKGAREFLTKSDVVLCLLHWKEQSIDTIDALDTCLGKQRLSVILALTKFDETGLDVKSRDDFKSALLRLEKQHPTLEQLRGRLERSFNSGTFYTLPVSALGADLSQLPRTRFPLTRNDLKPINIFHALALAIERKQETLARNRKSLERVEAELKQIPLEEGARLKTELEELEQEVTDALDAGTLGWYNSPVNNWCLKLEKIKENAKPLGCDDLLRSCWRLTKQIQQRRLHYWLIVFIVTIVLVAVAVIMYILSQPNSS